MEIELRLRLKSSDFYEKLQRFAREQLTTNPHDSSKVGTGHRNAVQFDIPLLSLPDEKGIAWLVATDLHLSNNTRLHVTINDASAMAWWNRLFAEMSRQGWTDWMPPNPVVPSETDDLMSHYLYAISRICQIQGWEMKYLQPVSDDRTFCQIEAALTTPERKYKAMVRVTLNTKTPDKPLIEGAYHRWSQDNLTTSAFAESLQTELLHTIKRWRERYPTQSIEDTVLAYLDAENFQKKYPIAYQKWSDAAKLLSAGDLEKQFTTIGHLLRETMQEYANTLVEKYPAPNSNPDKTKTIDRVRAVLTAREKELGGTLTPFLEALLTYWGTINDLVQRQEHGAQKEGKPLIREDARRVVFQTAVVVFEIDRALALIG